MSMRYLNSCILTLLAQHSRRKTSVLNYTSQPQKLKKRNLKSHLYPTIIKNVDMENDELNQIINDISTDSKFVKTLKIGKLKQSQGTKLHI